MGVMYNAGLCGCCYLQCGSVWLLFTVPICVAVIYSVGLCSCYLQYWRVCVGVIHIAGLCGVTMRVCVGVIYNASLRGCYL